MRSVLTALCLFASTAHAVPAQFTHQGRLLDADGEAREGDATITFRVTDSESGGTALWEETLTLSLTGGFYAAVLGAEEDNPLDTDVLSQAPVWLELQLEGEGTMFPRSPINAVPYATMATVAEEVSGGPVDASQIAVDGTPVVNELGEWVGPAPTVNWTDIEGMPEDFADGVDDDTDTDTDSFAALGTSCLDGDIPVWDSILTEWTCGIDTVLTEGEVDAIVADNGYAMESEVFSSSFLDLVDVPDGLDDGDDDTQLSESEVDGMVADNGYAMAADAFSRLFGDLLGIPEDLADGDDVLTEDEVDAYVADDIATLLAEIEVLKEQQAEMEVALEAATDSTGGTVMYGNYYIYNSVELADLEGFTEITGNLSIEAGDVPSLEALSSLERIGGNLWLQNNASLEDLNGLNSLTTVGGSVGIQENAALSSLRGIESLTTVGGSFEIRENPMLATLEGPTLLTTAGSFAVHNSDALTSLAGMESLNTLDDCLQIYSSDGLTSLGGLSGIRSVQCIHIGSNTALESISALDGLTEFTGDTLNIYSNSALCNTVAEDFALFIRSLLPTDSSYLGGTVGGNDDC